MISLHRLGNNFAFRGFGTGDTFLQTAYFRLQGS